MKIMNENKLKWDTYFLRVAKEVATNSKCLSRKIGAVLVRDKSIISTGYNGPPCGVRHCNERTYKFYSDLDKGIVGEDKAVYFIDGEVDKPTECPRRALNYPSGKGLHLCQAGHAERNAIVQAARNGICTRYADLYCYCPLPCAPCMIEIINAGINSVICLEGLDYDNYTWYLANEANIRIRKINKELI
jgi:dCMP deaminase